MFFCQKQLWHLLPGLQNSFWQQNVLKCCELLMFWAPNVLSFSCCELLAENRLREAESALHITAVFSFKSKAVLGQWISFQHTRFDLLSNLDKSRPTLKRVLGNKRVIQNLIKTLGLLSTKTEEEKTVVVFVDFYLFFCQSTSDIIYLTPPLEML